METALEVISRKHRQYARRQLSWFRHQPDIHWLDFGDEARTEDLAGQVFDLWARFSEDIPLSSEY